MFSEKELVESLVKICKTNVSKLCELWSEMGLEKLDDRTDSVQKYIEKSFKRMIHEEKGHLNEILKKIEVLEAERMRLICDLNRNTDVVDAQQMDPDLLGLPLVKLVDKLKLINEDLTAAKEQRMVEIRSLAEENDRCSRQVGHDPLPVPPDTILNPQELQDLRDHIQKMQELRRRRQAQLEEMQIEISNLCGLLDVEPRSSAERHLVCQDPADCVLSEANMSVVRELLERLQRHLELNTAKRQEMTDKILSLCSRLNLEAKPFLPETERVNDKTLAEIEASVVELEVLKKQHMNDFIAASKKELELVWNQCYVSNQQQKEFLPFFSQNVDEETLNALDQELDRLRNYHQHNRHLFDKVDEWHQVWFRKLDLENKGKDKGRLLGRGRNNLLEEEKQRKAVQKKLPKLERELQGLVDAFGEANPGLEFRLNGLKLGDYIREQKAEHNMEVTDEQSARKEIKRKILQHETMYGAQPLTPINMTSAALMKSRRNLALSTTKSGKRVSFFFRDTTIQRMTIRQMLIERHFWLHC